jgi:hypothetical protein
MAPSSMSMTMRQIKVTDWTHYDPQDGEGPLAPEHERTAGTLLVTDRPELVTCPQCKQHVLAKQLTDAWKAAWKVPVDPAGDVDRSIAFNGDNPVLPRLLAEAEEATKLRDQLEGLDEELERYKKLAEDHLDKTADGFFVCECNELYCPNCREAVRQFPGLCYCDYCGNPDDGAWPHKPPLPLSYTSTLAKPGTSRPA